MASLELFTLLSFIVLVCRDFTKCEDNLPEPCAVEDTECQNKAVEEFLQVMSAGMPQFNIEPIDPMSIGHVGVTIGDIMDFTFENTQIKGFSNEKISDFKFDKEARTMSYNGADNLIINGDVTIHYHKLGKNLSGTHSTTADVNVNVVVSYDLEMDDEGLQHITFGPATVTCEASSVHYTLNSELEQARNDDAEIMELQKKHAANESKLSQEIVCKFVEAGYFIIDENFKTIAKIVPTTTFFTNL